jgi:deferrochelatase/peroxidase EfeB
MTDESPHPNENLTGSVLPSRARRAISRRAFLGAAAATGVGAAIASSLPGSGLAAGAATIGRSAIGDHQPGILDDPSPAVSVSAFDVIVENRADLVDLLQTISQIGHFLTNGGPPPNLGPGVPPDDNGILGPEVPAGQLQLTVGLGSSLFDDRFGLAPQKPRVLKLMTPFPDDHLDPTQTQGDLSIQLRGTATDVVVHGLRYLMKYTSGAMQPRWRIDGIHGPARPSGTPRNYQGFMDGIAHPNVSSPTIADELLWVQPNSNEPAWTAGGSYQAIRIIRMFSEFWDRVSLQEQETMIGRRKNNGAPLDGNNENDTPNYKADPLGNVIPLTAHIRLANPRTDATDKSQILRRAWNFDLGLDTNGNLNQGLIFTAYQQDLERQFEAVQTRLIGEPLVDYIKPVGGGYFFAPRGLRDRDDYIASDLFTTT